MRVFPQQPCAIFVGRLRHLGRMLSWIRHDSPLTRDISRISMIVVDFWAPVIQLGRYITLGTCASSWRHLATLISNDLGIGLICDRCNISTG
ncbi:hypothetical protein SAMN04487959_114144 [Modicisalibacter xianhensis]|uniref:Uncharacterized protein n=2 Tax=Modicisalibacter xianhensis TaxID=442341 RepID=A0A1I3ES89_9GAMM|nr:hypothetical protein SAMN04487959_114144 [Halomonas xianhensis]